MHDIEPFYKWRADYAVEDDPQSPFHDRAYNDWKYVYNYALHPLWDEFGSATLYLKVLFADYDQHFAIIELIGEWNDTIYNDVMHLKRNVIEPMIDAGISKFILLMDNVLNFHGSEEDYYEEWAEECRDAFNGGWIVLLNTFDHVADEMRDTRLDNALLFGPAFNDISWRLATPQRLKALVERLIAESDKLLA